MDPTVSAVNQKAPDTFKAQFETNQGTFVILVMAAVFERKKN